jgi:hypothetical protein
MFLKPKFYGIIVLVTCFLVITGSYIYNNNNATSATPDENSQIDTILFSNDQYLSTEKNYYNALLNIQNEFPKKINTFQIVFQSDSEELIKKYRVTKYPTLLILDNEKVLVRIEGEHSEDRIFNKIEKVYK